MSVEIEVECYDCEGSGTIEEGLQSCNHGCDWCGGCFKDIPCCNCKGIGYILKDE